MIYLASPYSHADAAIREERFHDACRATAMLMQEGHVVFSPIAHSHPLVEHGLPSDWSFWQRYDRELLQRCDAVVVLMLDGWQQSVGVRDEIRIACELGKPVRYLNLDLATGRVTLAQDVPGGAGLATTPTPRQTPPVGGGVAAPVRRPLADNDQLLDRHPGLATVVEHHGNGAINNAVHGAAAAVVNLADDANARLDVPTDAIQAPLA